MAHLDVQALHATLDGERRRRGLSWRQVSQETGVSASTLSRMGKHDARPDVDGFATLVRWLGASADDFIRDGEDEARRELSPPAAVGAYLRARKDISPKAVTAIEAIIEAASDHLRPDPPASD